MDNDDQQKVLPTRVTYNVEEAGALAGLSRGASYEAVKRGEMPVIRIGSRLLVPKKKWDAILAGEEG
jgi:excisionase family DNA binding protein